MTSTPNDSRFAPSPQGAGGQPERGPAEAVPAPRAPGGEAGWRWFGWIAAIAGVVYWASVGVTNAKLAYEDGSILFQRHYQEISPVAWFGTWGGYSSLVPNLLGSLMCRLPTLWVPYAFPITAATLLVIGVTRLLDRRFDAVAPLATRVAIVVALAWIPFGDTQISSSLMYSQVPLLGWLVFALLRPAVGVRPVRDGVIVTLLTWSHPMSVALVPISLWRLREKAVRPVAIAHIVASAAFYLFGRDGDEPLFFGRIVEVPAWLATRTGFEPVFGAWTAAGLREAGFGWLAVATGVGILALLCIGVRCAWPRWAPQTRLLATGLTWMAIASAIGVVLLRGDMAFDPWGTRYTWIGCVALITILLLVMSTFSRLWWTFALVAAWVPWLGQFAARDWRYRPIPRTPEFSAFLEQLAAQEQERGTRRAVDIRLERPDQGVWFTIELKPK